MLNRLQQFFSGGRNQRYQAGLNPLFLAFLAILTGALAAYGAIGFRLLFMRIQHVAYFSWSDQYFNFSDLPLWHRLVGLTLGGLVVGLILRMSRMAQLFGPADAIDAIYEKDGKMPIKEGLMTALLCSTSIGAGSSVGRYGPALHLGASLGSGFAQKIGLARINVITLVGCGIASALASSFNTPIAAIVFTHEAIIGHYSLRAFAPITIASVTGTAITLFHGLDYDAFSGLTPTAEIGLTEYPLLAALGFLGALVALLFMRLTLKSASLADKWKLAVWIRPMIAGFIVGLIGIQVPEIIGLGEDAINGVLGQNPFNPEYSMRALLVICGLKLVLTSICLGFSFGSGVFGPALYIGAMFGAAFGVAVAPESYPVYVLAGMGSVISSVVGAPLATILIVFELSTNYSVTTGVMIAVVVANVTINRLFSRSYFYYQLRLRSIDLSIGRETRILQARRLKEITSPDYSRVSPDTSLADVEQMLRLNPTADLYVVRNDGRLLGEISVRDIFKLHDGELGNTARIAGDLVRGSPIVLTAETSLDASLKAIESFVGISLPVVNNLEQMEMEGIVFESTIIQAYNEAVREARDEERGI